MKFPILISILFLGGCAGSYDPDVNLAEDLRTVFLEIESPEVLDGRVTEVIEHSKEYARLLSGYIGAPKDFDLMLSIGNINHLHRRYEEAEIFYQEARSVPPLASHRMISNSVIVGTPERIKEIGEDSLINSESLAALSKGDVSLLSSAIRELAEKAKYADIRVTMIYGNLIAVLANRESELNTSTEQLLEKFVFEPIWLELLEGKEFEHFSESVRNEKHSYRQTVMINDATSIISYAASFWNKRPQAEKAALWEDRKRKLLELLVKEGLIKELRAEKLEHNKSSYSTPGSEASLRE